MKHYFKLEKKCGKLIGCHNIEEYYLLLIFIPYSDRHILKSVFGITVCENCGSNVLKINNHVYCVTITCKERYKRRDIPFTHVEDVAHKISVIVTMKR